jgi:hypothetical protein
MRTPTPDNASINGLAAIHFLFMNALLSAIRREPVAFTWFDRESTELFHALAETFPPMAGLTW